MLRLCTALAFFAGCSDSPPPCDLEPDPTAELAADAVSAAADAATVVDVSVGGLVGWTYEGKDTRDATVAAFLAIFGALDESPWDACVTYEESGLSSMYTTFEACVETGSTPAVSGTVHVYIEGSIGGEGGVELHTQLLASGVEIDGSTLDLTAGFTWDPAPEAGLRSQSLTATVRLPAGDSVSVAGHVGLDADPTCQTIEGDLATSGPAGTVTVVGFEQCLGACPTAGGRIFYEGAQGVVEVELDGTSTATAHGPCGDFPVPLDC